MPTFDGVIETPLEYWLGTDKAYEFTLYTDSTKTVIRDATGYTTNLMVKRKRTDLDAAALISASGVVSGTFNANPSINTQKITATISDEATDTEIAEGLTHWELKRTDAGSEAVLAYGAMTLRRAVHVS